MGDYVEGSSLAPVVVNIGFNRDHRVDHVGLGFNVQLTSGRVHADGFTWTMSQEQRAQVQAIVDVLLRDACQVKGLTLAGTVPPPPEVVKPA